MRSPAEAMTILLFLTAVLSLGFALDTSRVAVNLSLGNVPLEGIVPKYVDGNCRLILPDVRPLAVSVADVISTASSEM